MQGKTFTIISYKNKKFSLKKDWFATDKNDMPDWDIVYYFFYDKEKKQGNQVTCFSYTKESHSKPRPQVIAVMTGYDYRQCIYKDGLDYFEGLKAGVEQLLG